MLGTDRNAARYTWTAALVLLLLVLVYEIRQVLFLLIIAVLFAYLLFPLVNMLNRWLPGRSRTPALAMVFLVVMGLLTLGVVEFGSVAAEQATSLAARAPELLKNLQKPAAVPVPAQAQPLKSQVIAQVQNAVRTHYGQVVGYLPHLLLNVLAYSTNLLYLVIVPILSFFLLKDAQEIHQSFMRVIPAEHSEKVEGFLQDVHLLLIQYVRALFLLGLGTFVIFSIALSVMGVSYSVLLAVVAFPLEFVPLIGPLVAGGIILVVAAATGYAHILWVVLFLGIYRIFQDYVISPRLMSSGVEVHPLLVILGVFAGERIGGVPGMFLAVLTIALLRVAYRRVIPR
jgi:predicted PurR-regulated permease PerM